MISMFRGLSLLAQIGSVLAVVIAGFAAFKAWEWKNFNEGRVKERTVIEQQNREAIGDANKNSSVRAQCVDAFGADAWDVSRGVCNQ